MAGIYQNMYIPSTIDNVFMHAADNVSKIATCLYESYAQRYGDTYVNYCMLIQHWSLLQFVY
jgi:hypothetical protein